MSDNWLYSDTVKDHFFNPRNILFEEEKINADGIGEVGSPACGDVMKVWIRVNKKTDLILEMKWKTFGCASAIGSMSILSVMVTENNGMSINDALNITSTQILERLGGLPKNKVHCSVLGDKALRAAIYDYFRKSGQTERINEAVPQKIVCGCLGVSEREIQLAVAAGDRTFEEIRKRTKAGTGCEHCVPKIKKMSEELIKNAEHLKCKTCIKRCCEK